MRHTLIMEHFRTLQRQCSIRLSDVNRRYDDVLFPFYPTNCKFTANHSIDFIKHTS